MLATAENERGKVLSRLTVVAIAALDVVLRAHELVTRAVGVGTSQFDEGVYTSAAASLTRGDLPYRDFVFLHPPGVTIVLAPVLAVVTAVGGWSDGLYAARWLMTLIAVTNVVLVFVVALRWRGWVAGAVAGGLFASYLPAVHTESHVMLEPLVTLGLLVGALAWIGEPTEPRSPRQTAGAGVVAALTAMTKLTGAAVFITMLLIDRPTAARRDRGHLTAWAAGTTAILLLPFALFAGPATVLRQVVWAQVRRPGADVGGGTIQGLSDRLDHLGSYGPFALDRLGADAGAAGAALAVAVVLWALVRGGTVGRFFAVSVVLGGVLILSAPDYYDQYPVTVFAGIAVLVGGASASVLQRIGQNRLAGVLATGLIAAGLAAGVADAVVSVVEDVRDRNVHDRGAAIADTIADRCVSADDPEVLLSIDRLPPRDATGERLVDPFGALMYAAMTRHDYRTTPHALQSTDAQRRLQTSLNSCPYAVTHGTLDAPPPRWSNATVIWFKERFQLVEHNEAGIVLWKRR